MKRIALLISLLLLGGCIGGGRMDHSSGTDVQLSHGNYHVVRSGVQGTSSGFWLLFLPILLPNYADAKADLYKNAGQSLDGRSVALANVTEDRSFFTLLLFSVPRVKVTADIVEFTDAPMAQPAPIAPSTGYLPEGSSTSTKSGARDCLTYRIGDTGC